MEITRRKRKLGPQPEPKRNTFLDWNRSAEIYAFNKRLSESFDTEKLEQAFTHKSYLIREEQRQREMGIENPVLIIQDNIEFINKGDQLTSEIVQNYLAQVLPHAPEDVIMYVPLKNIHLYKRITFIYYSTRIIENQSCVF